MASIERINLITEKAAFYRDLGWQVMPLKPKSKAPALVQWKQLIDKEMTDSEFDRAFSPALSGGNIALVTGKISGVTVIDIDAKRADGKPVIPPKDLLDRLPPTLTSLTGGGGYHLFYEYTHEISNSVKHIHPQVDIKNDGGYVLLPPSIHDVTGEEYKWLPNAFTKFIAHEVKELQSIEPAGKLSPFPPKILAIDSAKRTNPVLRNRDWTRIVRGTRLGSRNNDLAKLTGKLLKSFCRNPVTYKEDLVLVYELIELWNQERCSPPLTKAELDRTFNSITSRHYEELRRGTRPGGTLRS